MHVLNQCCRDALIKVWWRRTTLLHLLVLTWLPVYAFVATFPKYGRAAAPAVLEMSLAGIAELLWYGAILQMVRADIDGHQIGALVALRRSRKSFPRLFGLHYVLGARIMVGFLALLVPGFVMFVRYALMDVLGVCEDVGPTQCRTRSTELVTPHWKGVSVFIGLFYALVLTSGALADWCNELLEANTAMHELVARALAVIVRTVAASLTAILPLTLFEFYRKSTESSLEKQQPRRA